MSVEQAVDRAYNELVDIHRAYEYARRIADMVLQAIDAEDLSHEDAAPLVRDYLSQWDEDTRRLAVEAHELESASIEAGRREVLDEVISSLGLRAKPTLEEVIAHIDRLVTCSRKEQEAAESTSRRLEALAVSTNEIRASLCVKLGLPVSADWSSIGMEVSILKAKS